MGETIVFERSIDDKDLTSLLRNIEFRGLYSEKGERIKPYKDAKFSLITVSPPETPTSFPMLDHNGESHPLFTAQPTIYSNQIQTLEGVDKFLETLGKRIHQLEFEAVRYESKGVGRFHVLPPIVEKHSYPLLKGALDLEKIAALFKGAYVRDARGKPHDVSEITLRDYYVDQEKSIGYLDIFNPNVELINYGLRFTGNNEFYVICDGSHRMDYALEYLNEPTTAIVVEGKQLFPYYALPMPFRPATRLTSKAAERAYPHLERDKVHLFSDLLKKVLHYDWEVGGLYVSKLRQQTEIY